MTHINAKFASPAKSYFMSEFIGEGHKIEVLNQINFESYDSLSTEKGKNSKKYFCLLSCLFTNLCIFQLRP